MYDCPVQLPLFSRKFTDKERDSESNIDNFGSRFDSSSIGRFMSPDPLGILAVKPGFPQSWNLYSYVLNDPTSATDPTGLWCVWEDNTHDDDPSDGGATSGECSQQGGHWDNSDTIYGILTDTNGNVTSINYLGVNYSATSLGLSLGAFDVWLHDYNNPNATSMQAAPQDCSLAGRLLSSTEITGKVGVSVKASKVLDMEGTGDYNPSTGQWTANSGVTLLGLGISAQRSLSTGNLTPDNVDPNPQFNFEAPGTQTSLVTGQTTPSASKLFTLGGAYGVGFDVSFNVERFNQVSAACSQPK